MRIKKSSVCVNMIVLAVLAIAILEASSHAQSTAPVPLINEPLVPATVVPGGPGFTLTVNGTGFVQGSVVEWNGSARSTTFVNGSQLTAAILATDVVNPNTATITVSNLPTGKISNTVFFTTTIATQSVVLNPAYITSLDNPDFVAIGDLNNDGKVDLVVSTTGSSISVLLGNGDGTFQNPQSYPTSNGPLFRIAVADLNNDGNADVVAAHSESNIISVFLGNGDGTLQPSVDYEVGNQPFTPIAADFNGDGILDLAVTNAASNSISVLLGNGDGTFQTQVVYTTGANPDTVVTGDFNGDGILDLAVSDSGSNSVSILLGNGDGTFGSGREFSTGSFPRTLVAADFNGDGHLDLATVNPANSGGATSISVLLGNGDGTFQPFKQYGSGDELLTLITADLNGDGKLDLAAVDYDDNLAILLGNGDGTFQPQLNTPLSVPVGLAYADVNGDGRLDLVAPTNYYENGPGITILIQSPTVSLAPNALGFGNQHVGSTSNAQKVILTNSGSATLEVSSISIAGSNSGDFLQTNNCGTTLLAGASCSISVTFSPTAIGNRAASVTISDNASGTPQIVALSGTGMGAVVTLSPVSLGFGNQTVGIASPAQSVTVTNSGNANLTIRSISLSLSNGSVVQSNNCGSSLGVGDSCAVNVSWTPRTTGNMTGNMTVSSNAINNPQALPVAGIGVIPAVTVSPTSLSFPDQIVFRNSNAQDITLTDSGAGTLAIRNVSVTGPFSQTNNCGSSVNAGNSCTIAVTFRPETIGTLTGAVTIMDNAPGSPQRIALTGVGTDIQLSPATLIFGDQTVGTTSVPKTVTLYNKATIAVSIDGISVTGADIGDFTQTNTCGSSVAAGASCSITVTFTPTAKGRRTAAISVSDSGGGSPQSTVLSGMGT